MHPYTALLLIVGLFVITIHGTPLPSINNSYSSDNTVLVRPRRFLGYVFFEILCIKKCYTCEQCRKKN